MQGEQQVLLAATPAPAAVPSKLVTRLNLFLLLIQFWFIVTGLTPKRVCVVCYRAMHIFVVSFDQCITALTYLTYHEVHG